MSEKPFTFILGGLFGIFAVIFFLVGMFISLFTFPDYNMLHNMISELGLSTSGFFFNLGLFLSGLIAIPFYTNLSGALKGLHTKDGMRKIAIVSAFISCFSYCFIAIFPADFSNIPILITHTIFTFLSFISGFIYLICFSILMMKSPNFNKFYSIYGFIVAASYIAFLCTWYPIIEWITSFGILSWILLNSIYLLIHYRYFNYLRFKN